MAVEIVPYVEGVSKPPKRDLTKEPPFGMWTVVSFAGVESKHGKSCWNCRCECGTERIVVQGNLLSGMSVGCGCGRVTTLSKRATHRMGGTPEHRIWAAMLTRCRNPNSTNFHNYGGRGITVCERWQKFENFYADMGPRPSVKHSIDRFPDNDGNYSKENCRWATKKEQASNTRSNRPLEYKGTVGIMSVVAEQSGVNYSTLQSRLACGWSTEDAIETPVKPNKAKLYAYKGESRTILDWAALTRIPVTTLRSRIRLGWSVEDTIERPVKSK